MSMGMMVSFFRVKKFFLFLSLLLLIFEGSFSFLESAQAIEIDIGPSRKEQEKDVQYGIGTFDKKGDDVRISRFYRRGPYLIYDCESKHFACVTEENFEDCGERRKKAKIWNKKNLVCAPLKKFEKRLACEKTHRKKLLQRSPEPLCKP